MAGATPLYEFESRSFEHSTSELPKLEALAEKLRAGCTAHSLFGMHEYRLDARPGGTILDQAHEDDRDFAEGVLVSAGIEDPGSVDTIFANIITGAGNYNSYLRVNADTAVGNFHADPRIITQDGQVLFLPPRAGRLAIALFDDGIWGIDNTITVPVSRTTHYTWPHPTARSGYYYEGMRKFRQILVGEDSHFLRGPADIDGFGEKYQAVRHTAEQWRYWGLEFVHRAGQVTEAGRVQIAVDFKPGRDPYLQNA